MTPQEYILDETAKGRFTLAHVQVLVQYFQAAFPQLQIDGRPGPKTRDLIESWAPTFFLKKPSANPEDTLPFLRCPLPALSSNGRSGLAMYPQITSQFRKPDRPDHDGCDMFYKWRQGDLPNFVGDGGCEGKNPDGTPKWVVPYGTDALAAADGTVQTAGPSPTGYRVWIDHGNGLRSGYFHLEKCYVTAGQKVVALTAVGLVGHNPALKNGKPVADGRHLHFEVSLVEKYHPLDPQKYLLPIGLK